MGKIGRTHETLSHSLLNFLSSRREKKLSMKAESTALAGQRETTYHEERERARKRESEKKRAIKREREREKEREREREREKERKKESK